MFFGLLTHKFVKFSFWGGLVFAAAVALNVILVEAFAIEKSIAYVFVILSQIIINFILNRYVIFEIGERKSWEVFIRYVIAVGIFRGIDWTMYLIQIKWIFVPYIIAQVINTILIFFGKYFFYKVLFEKGLKH